MMACGVTLWHILFGKEKKNVWKYDVLLATTAEFNEIRLCWV